MALLQPSAPEGGMLHEKTKDLRQGEMHKGLAKETTQEGGPGLKWGWAIYDIIFEYICADEMNEHHLQI